IWDAATGALQHTLESHYMTARCAIQLRVLVETYSRAQLQAQASETPPSHDCGLSPDKIWIKWNGHNTLWLPPDYRPFASAISPSTTTIALGCPSGRVLVIGFL
ncbi:hypothetical protein B0T10DRAFT_367152, partial [Thelonectria olida]